jgi:hypothetical protein
MKTLLALLAACTVLLSGCAAVDPCASTMTYTVIPASATVDHMAAPPGNQQQFVATVATTFPTGCPAAIPAVVAIPAYATAWSSSDPVNAPIDNVVGPTTNGVATCKGATTVPVTITASSGPASAPTATATLVCK